MNARSVTVVVALGAAVAAVLPLRGRAAESGLLPSVIHEDTTISGAWRMGGDVEVAAGATLRIAAGTTIEVSALDGERGGFFPRLAELHVHGRLLCDGTRDQPVVFRTPEPKPRETSPWRGITLHADRSRAPDSAILCTKFLRAEEAILVTDGAPRIEECVFHSCGAGVLAACVLDEAGGDRERGLQPQPTIVRSLFVRCALGVFAELDAAPDVQRSTFIACEVGIGNERPRSTAWPLTGMGPRADRCLFLRNRIGVACGGVVENSIFLRNDTVVRLTEFHSTYAARTDRFAWRRNVLWDNVLTCVGEADVGEDNLVVNPRLENEPAAPAFEAAVAPPPGAGLAEFSPVRGIALDGGDPGPFGAGPVTGRGRRWKSAAGALRTVLVLGPPDRVDVKNLPKTPPAAAGERVGAAWWAAFPVADDGAFHRAALRAPSSVGSIVLAFPWVADPAEPATSLEVNADGRIAMWRAGAPLKVPAVALRHGSVGTRAALAPGAPEGVVVWWSSDDVDPRLGVALDHGASPPTDASPVAAIEAGPVRFGPRQAGLRLARPFHWDDLRRKGVIRLRTADGTVHEAEDLSLVLYDGNGTLRVDLPAGFEKKGARFLIDGLRDPAGRVLAGQPFECDASLSD